MSYHVHMNESLNIDSAMTHEEVIAQNSLSPAPQEILEKIVVLEVMYLNYNYEIHVGQIAIHQDVADDVKDFFRLALEQKFLIEKVIPVSNEKYGWDDGRSCADNNSSGYNYRCIAGTNKLSYHARGCAFDINPVQNVYIKYDEKQREIFRVPKDVLYDERVKGTLTKNHPLVVFMKEHGWIWGGDWTPEEGRIDYQHFEKRFI